MSREIVLPIKCSTVKTVAGFTAKTFVFLITLYTTISFAYLLYLAAYYNGMPAPFPYYVQAIGFIGLSFGLLATTIIFWECDSYRQYIAPVILVGAVCWIIVYTISKLPTIACIKDDGVPK